MVISLCFGLSVRAQTLQTHVKTDSLFTGDVFTYTIVLKADTVYEDISFPDSSDFGSEITIRDNQQFRTGNLTDSLVYELQFFGTENLELPRLPVVLSSESRSKTVYTDAVSIPFKSLLASEDPLLRPLKPIFNFPGPWWPYLLAVVLLSIAGFFLYRYWKARKPVDPEPKPSEPPPFYDPLLILEERLDALQNKTRMLNSREEYKQYYIQLGDALRAYIEDLYKIPALESTSNELYRYMDAFGINEELSLIIREILQEADMVKFAKHHPATEDAEYAYQKAREFLNTARKEDRQRINKMREKHERNYHSQTKKDGVVK